MHIASTPELAFSRIHGLFASTVDPCMQIWPLIPLSRRIVENQTLIPDVLPIFVLNATTCDGVKVVGKISPTPRSRSGIIKFDLQVEAERGEQSRYKLNVFPRFL